MLIKLRNFVAKHRVPVAVTFAILAAAIWANGSYRLRTRFVVQADTTSLAFTALEQNESQSQAGLFASPETPVDLMLSCSKLERVGSLKSALPCTDHFLTLHHVFVESLRLGQNTRVSIHVADKNLDETLTPTSGSSSLLTLLFDKSQVEGISDPAADLEGEWMAVSADEPLHLTFLQPHFRESDDEGGQQLSENSNIGFQHDDQSSFTGDKGLLSVEGRASEMSDHLHSRLLQIRAAHSGLVHRLSPINDDHGGIEAIHVEISGSSNRIEIIDFSGDASNRASTFAEQVIGRRVDYPLLFKFLLTSILLPIIIAMIASHYSKHIEARPAGDRKELEKNEQNITPAAEPMEAKQQVVESSTSMDIGL